MERIERQQKLINEATLDELLEIKKWATEVVETWDSIESLFNDGIWKELAKDLECHVAMVNQMKSFREALADLEIAIEHKKSGHPNIKDLIAKHMPFPCEEHVCLLKGKPGYTTTIHEDGTIIQTKEDDGNERSDSVQG